MKIKYLQLISQNQKEFLRFLKSKFELFHFSNVFFRDIHYGVWEYLEKQRVVLRYDGAEKKAIEVIALFEKENVLKRLNERTWLLNYSEFKLAPIKLMPTLRPYGKLVVAA